jgi:peptidoglycan-associated lipoprotein
MTAALGTAAALQRHRLPGLERPRKDPEMNPLTRTLRPATVAALVVFAVACSKQPKPQTTPEPTPTPVPVAVKPAPTPVPVPSAPPERPRVTEVTVTDRTLAEISGYLKPAFFDYDAAEIRPDAREALGADAEFLRKWPTVKVTIEGFCDERGTRQYNMALGQRRAGAARDFLVSLGIDSRRIQILSYGKERPFCAERTEECWQKNRRANFVVTAK